MNDNDESKQLGMQNIDYVTSAVKAIVGAAPFAGSLLVELAGTVIPNQRMDRIAKFAENLETRLRGLEQEFVYSQLKNEDFADLIEESVRQAAHSLSDERREYISNLLANSLSPHEVEYMESKQLLRILGELSDIEIIWLRSHLLPRHGSNDDFRLRHSHVLNRIFATLADPESVVDKEALQKSHEEHLAQLGLLKASYAMDNKTKLPEFDEYTGALSVRGYELTRLGQLLLRQIGVSGSE